MPPRGKIVAEAGRREHDGVMNAPSLDQPSHTTAAGVDRFVDQVYRAPTRGLIIGPMSVSGASDRRPAAPAHGMNALTNGPTRPRGRNHPLDADAELAA